MQNPTWGVRSVISHLLISGVAPIGHVWGLSPGVYAIDRSRCFTTALLPQKTCYSKERGCRYVLSLCSVSLEEARAQHLCALASTARARRPYRAGPHRQNPLKRVVDAGFELAPTVGAGPPDTKLPVRRIGPPEAGPPFGGRHLE